jgi:flagellar hook-length control protein FliK
MQKSQIIRNIKLTEMGRAITNIVKNTQADTTSTARLLLKPESLGTVFVEITMKGNMAKLNIKADSREAVKSLESQIAALRDKLSQNGIKTESVDVRQRSDDGFARDGGSRERQFSKSYRDDRRTRRDFLNSFAAGSDSSIEEAKSQQH